MRIDDKVSLFESNAINEYLDETIAPRLHPDDPVLRAVNRAWTDYVPTFAEHVTGMAYADDEAGYKVAAGKIPVAFERLERALEGRRTVLQRGQNIRWSMPPMRRSCSAIISSTASRRSA